ncbi:hypothetical protein TELCIR_02344 [Teladorsagia circumcincta]|uniref:Uncharacterized protein n=1 Tax=Teladorsagia circumcincta TaxID=45464 RepID=A0A2G9UZI0_TELCI|nr:hypothetical protein TELCIR_02344 [Teladorsagia circumcincta]
MKRVTDYVQGAAKVLATPRPSGNYPQTDVFTFIAAAIVIVHARLDGEGGGHEREKEEDREGLPKQLLLSVYCFQCHNALARIAALPRLFRGCRMIFTEWQGLSILNMSRNLADQDFVEFCGDLGTGNISPWPLCSGLQFCANSLRSDALHRLCDGVLAQQVPVEDALQYLKSLRNALPIVWWKSVCYHYVRKTRQVTRYRNGDAVPATQVYYERVDSHSAGNVFIYDVCGVKDISKTVLDLERFPLTRVRVTRGFVFACMQAAREFEQQRTRFFNENETRDDYMEVREGMDLSDVSVLDDMLVFRGSQPWFLRASIFWYELTLLFPYFSHYCNPGSSGRIKVRTWLAP